MRARARWTGVAAIAASVLLLAACAPSAPTTPAPGSGAPHASATPTVTQSATPGIRVPVSCGSLFSDGTVESMIGAPVATRLDETSTPVNIVDITARQYGDLVCLWNGADQTDGAPDQNLTVAIAPDAASGFTANIAQLESAVGTPTAENTAGDRSEYFCQVQNELQCTANMLVGQYWVTVTLNNLAGTVAQSMANSRIQSVLSTVATALAGKAARGPWTPPGGSLPTFCTEGSSVAAVDAALGTTDAAPQGDDEGTPDADSYAQRPGVFTECTWGTSSGSGPFTFAAIAMLRGGAWAVPQLAGASDSDSPQLGPYVAVSIPGADSAVETCSTAANECQLMLAVGHLLVNINLDDPGTAKANAAAAKLLASIAAS